MLDNQAQSFIFALKVDLWTIRREGSSLGECLTRTFGLARVELILPEDAEKIDLLLYEVENILLGLIRSLESKRANGSWNDTLPTAYSTPPPSPPR